MSGTAWHYTIEHYLSPIIRSGYLKPATAGVPPPEKPVVWFSRNPEWEPSAAKGAPAERIMRKEHASIETLKRETIEVGGGLVRFAYPSEKLLPWKKLTKTCRMNPRLIRTIEAIAIRDGSPAHLYCGSLSPVSVDACIVERWDQADEVWIVVNELELDRYRLARAN